MLHRTPAEPGTQAAVAPGLCLIVNHMISHTLVADDDEQDLARVMAV